MPTLMGRDSDDDRSLGEVGHCGVAIDSAIDMDVLFADIPLGDVTTSMTISGPAVPIFCMYLVAAERQGVDPAVLNGTLQTDIFKEYIAQKEWLFAPEPHLRLIADLMEYCAQQIPAYKPLSVSGYHIREAGATAAQELAFTLADGFGYVELLSRCRRVRVGAVLLLRRAHRLLRRDCEVPGRSADLGSLAARRLRRQDRQGAVAALHTQTAGVSLTGHQPYNNVVRTAVEALSAVAVPTPAHQRARRGARVADRAGRRDRAADPTGADGGDRRRQRRRSSGRVVVCRGVDRSDRGRGGSDLREDPRDGRDGDPLAQAYGPMTAGILRGIEDGWFMSEIAESAFWYQQQVEKGDKRVVGVNVHTDTITGDLDILRVSHEVETEQRRALVQRRARRDDAAVRAAVARMVEVSRGNENMIPSMLDAVRAEATLGEICDALRAEWGVYTEPARF